MADPPDFNFQAAAPGAPAQAFLTVLSQISPALYALVQATKTNPVTSYTFATLPASPGTGTLAVVTDSNTVVWGANIAGGGTNTVLAFFNGSHWTVAAK